jgi:lysine 2,3-aminomutase
MAGFLEQIISTQKYKTNTYINFLLEEAHKKYGVTSSEYKGIFNQYFRVPKTDSSFLENKRHYEAEIHFEGIPKGLERLYRRSVVIDLLSACAAECIYCLRGYYEKFVLSNSEIKEIAEYCSKEKDLHEVLITGGDPFISPVKLKTLITELASKAPNIKIIRIGTRLPVQDPERFDKSYYSFFETLGKRFIFEIGCQINHYFELQPITKDILLNLQKAGCRLYSQNVLLKDVNDDIETLDRLYDELRYTGVLPHYFFHAVPMAGTDEFRTSVQKGISLARRLSSSGYVSGRAKPQYALMTDIGKVTLYHDTIIGKEGQNLLIKTEYNLKERQIWNPSYTLPDSAMENPDGTITVKYLDGQD